MSNTQITRYEIAVIEGESRWLVSYTAQHSFAGLRKIVYSEPTWCQLVSRYEGCEIAANKKAADGLTISRDGVTVATVRFTNRTQREALGEGTLFPLT